DLCVLHECVLPADLAPLRRVGEAVLQLGNVALGERERAVLAELHPHLAGEHLVLHALAVALECERRLPLPAPDDQLGRLRGWISRAKGTGCDDEHYAKESDTSWGHCCLHTLGASFCGRTTELTDRVGQGRPTPPGRERRAEGRPPVRCSDGSA